MTELPPEVRKYSQTPVFDEITVPEALLRDHTTKPGVWGRIVVEAGALYYTRQGHTSQRVDAGQCAIVLPQDPHHVTPIGSVRFKVEFFREKEKST